MASKYDPLFEALSNDVRREIISILKNKEMCAGDIHKKFISSRTAISYHLSVLNELGILKTRKEGREVFYQLDPDFIHKHLTTFIDKFVMALS